MSLALKFNILRTQYIFRNSNSISKTNLKCEKVGFIFYVTKIYIFNCLNFYSIHTKLYILVYFNSTLVYSTITITSTNKSYTTIIDERQHLKHCSFLWSISITQSPLICSKLLKYLLLFLSYLLIMEASYVGCKMNN